MLKSNQACTRITNKASPIVVKTKSAKMLRRCLQAIPQSVQARRLFGLSSGRVLLSQHAQRNIQTSAHASGTTTGNSEPRIVVLGGGFGGLYTAVRLTSLFWPRGVKPQITLVDQHDRFVFKPLLYELLNNAASENEVAPFFSQLLAPYPAINFVQAKVNSVDPSTPSPKASNTTGGTVQLSDGTTVPYDWLVMALGSGVDTRGIPGVKEHAIPFNNFEDAQRIKAVLDNMRASGRSANIYIVGAGYAGVELASVLSETTRDFGASVTVLGSGADILPSAPIGQRAAARDVLTRLGVKIMTGSRVQSLRPIAADDYSSAGLSSSCYIDLEPAAMPPSDSLDATESADSPTLTADLVIWTAGATPSTKNAGFPFPRNQNGAIKAEATLRVVDSTNVFALGDAAMSDIPYSPSPSGGPTSHLPNTAQVAFQQADYAAWNIWAAINNRPLLPFKYQHLGSMMALGQLNAAVAVPLSLPSPLTSVLESSPLGPLLSNLGVQLSSPSTGGSESSSSNEGITVTGPLAQLVRRAAYLYRQPTNEHRAAVAGDWLQQALGTVLASSTTRK